MKLACTYIDTDLILDLILVQEDRVTLCFVSILVVFQKNEWLARRATEIT